MVYFTHFLSIQPKVSPISKTIGFVLKLIVFDGSVGEINSTGGKYE
ncbi:hypothetical protein ECZC05_24540 [Escherichia coli]|nr:hypothetical protein ECZC05_24540 [Escherichia coli]GJH78470.1 hypothetical protein ECZC07_23920 [Escherichia coli]GJH85141.1 hypothetical protein ECZC08_37110 [Escherichia coli]GJI02018.1 hypothetical protein ECZC11_43890 [Escherichia coli]GJI06780.1 hypothetical protein ECZC12_37860 [Escherichia coli]